MIDPPCVCHVCGSSIDLSPEEARKFIEAHPDKFSRKEKLPISREDGGFGGPW